MHKDHIRTCRHSSISKRCLLSRRKESKSEQETTADILLLPEELIEEIFIRLNSFTEINRCGMVCHRFLDITTRILALSFQKLQIQIEREIQNLDNNVNVSYAYSKHSTQFQVFLRTLKSQYSMTRAIFWKYVEHDYCHFFAGELLNKFHEALRIYKRSKSRGQLPDMKIFERLFQLNAKLILNLERVLKDIDNLRNFPMDIVDILNCCVNAERKDVVSVTEHSCEIDFIFKLKDVYLLFAGSSRVITNDRMDPFKQVMKVLGLLVCRSNHHQFLENRSQMVIEDTENCGDGATTFSNKRIALSERLFMYGCRIQGKDISCVNVKIKFKIFSELLTNWEDVVESEKVLEKYKLRCKELILPEDFEVHVMVQCHSSYSTSFEYKRTLSLQKLTSNNNALPDFVI